MRPTPELRPEDRVRLAPGPPRSPGSCPRLPAVDDNGRVQRALMQVVGVHLLDEAQQVAGAVRQASAGGMGVSEPELVRASSAPPATPGSRRTARATPGSAGAQESA